MALGSTIHRIKLQLSDSDRGVYELLDLRLAQHPSETAAYLITRLLAYCFADICPDQWQRSCQLNRYCAKEMPSVSTVAAPP